MGGEEIPPMTSLLRPLFLGTGTDPTKPPPSSPTILLSLLCPGLASRPRSGEKLAAKLAEQGFKRHPGSFVSRPGPCPSSLL